MKTASPLSRLTAYAVIVAMLAGNVSPAYAQTDITINGSGSGSGDVWTSGSASTSYLHASGGGDSENYTDWVQSPLNDRLWVTGGSLTTNGLSKNGALYASGGNITVQSGKLTIDSGSYINSGANLTLGSGATLSITGGSVTINEGDSIDSGTLSLTGTGASLSFAGGTHSVSSGSSFSNTGTFSVADGANVTFNNPDAINRNLTNDGNVTLKSGVLDYAITGTGNTTFDGTVKLVSPWGNVTQTSVTNNGALTNGKTITSDLTNNATIAGTGTLITNTGTSVNNGTIEQTALTNNGTFTSNGKITLTNGLTNNSNATFNNNAMLLASATNAANSVLNSDPDNLGDDVANDGTLNLNADGTLSVEVTGTGITNINGDLNNQSTISQQDVTVASGKVVTTNASDITATNKITNDGIINYTGGTTGNTIDGTGRVDITGYVTNNGNITQDKVTNSGVFTNNGTVNGNLTNTNEIEGTGSITTGTGISTNNGTIAQNALTNNGTFDNNGHITLSGTSGTLTNNGTFNTNADLIAASGGVNNAGNFNITGGTNATAITGAAGTTNFSNTVVNEAAITQAEVTNSGNLTNNALITADVTNTGVLTSEGDKIVGDIDNYGTYVISDGDNANDIIGEGGTLSILGDTANTGTIMQETLTVANSGSLTTDSDLVIATITNDGKLKWNAGTANENVVNGTGQLDITGGTIANSAAISQNKIKITGGSLSSNADLLATASGITNNVASGLTLTGGTNNNVIDGSGSMSIAGNVTNNADITQTGLTVASGKLTTDAGSLHTTSGITNNSNLVFTGGSNVNDITGTGTTLIEGTVENAAAIDTVIGVGTNSHFATTADVTKALINNGITDVTNADISGAVSGTGTLQVLGTTDNNSTIAQSVVNIASGGVLTSNSNNIAAAINNDGNYTMNAGTGNTNVISGSGTLNVTGGTIANTAAITQNKINITGGTFTTDADLLASVGGIQNDAGLTFTTGTNTHIITGTTGTTTFDGNVVNAADITQQDVVVTSTGVLTNAGEMTVSSQFTNSGTVANSADITGTVANAGTFTNEADITGNIANNGLFNNTGDIITASLGVGNTGTFNNEGNIAGPFANSGTLNNDGDITGSFANTGTVNNDGTITGAITNSGSGVINSVATDLVGTINNTNVLNIAGGEVQGNITGSTGTMYITADLVNTKNITQATVDNSAVLTNSGLITAAITNTGTINSTADNLNGTVANAGTLNLNGGTTKAAITGTGNTTISADLTNNYVITQAAVTNDAVMTNNAAINATTFTNNDTVVNGAVITAADIINNATINGKASDLVASNGITNDGTLVFDAASTGASNISGTGEVQVTADTTLTGTNTYTGGTLIDGADLTVAGQTNLGTGDVTFANDGALVVTAAGTLTSNLLGQGLPSSEDVTVENAAALTLQGSINNAADFFKDGTGAMTFDMASNGYTGDTYVLDGTLIGNTSNINNAVIGLTGTTVNFTDNTDAELNEINTAGTFLKSGTGVFNVQNNSFLASTATIDAGTFAVNNAINADVLDVNTGATLRGNGSINDTTSANAAVVNINTGATIAPGNSIDTLTVNGDLNLASGSTTAIEINQTSSDKIVVTGATNIAGGANLTVANEDGRFFEWNSFDIIESGNTTGTFTYDGTIANYDASRINVELDYSDPTKVTLTAKRKATNYENTPTAALSRNASEAARAVDAISTGFGGDITNALLQLEKLGGLNPDGVTLINPNATFSSALRDLTGVLYANSALIPLLNAQTTQVYDRIAQRSVTDNNCVDCANNVWVQYYNQHDKVFSSNNSPRFYNNMSGALVGYDRAFGDVLVGAYAGFGKSDLRQHDDSRMDVEDTTFGVYSGYTMGDWAFQGTLFAGSQNYHGKRYISFMNRKADGKYNGSNVGLDLEASYNIPVFSWMNVKPFAGWLNSYAHQQAFTEKDADALNLHVNSNDQFHSQARLGVRVDGQIKNRLSWYGSVAVKQFIGGDYAKLRMNLDMPRTDMEIISAELGRTSFGGQVGANYALTNNWSVFANVEGNINDKSANCHGNLGVAYTW